ncbi:branched-chain amino acid transport system substrate-binding protein [Rhodoligotrophos appendicifer]|uniref:ABC transporter substrate-binding protein n=1 Tax=Rhodoligotrophos appendicifer TaxID=987056 RepID=UPI0011861B35|nr:ABC transporter substrate-binding protein [Rhodoligotrophos appendicifer]
MNFLTRTVAAVAMVFAFAVSAHAQVKIGIVISMTGPAATLGLPQKNAIALMPKTIGGQDVEYITLDDASDPTTARRLVERLITEDKVDLLMGPTISPSALAVVEAAGRGKTPMITFAAARSIVQPLDENRQWVYKTTINDDIFAKATATYMAAHDQKKVAVIGFNDAYGESWASAFDQAAKNAGLEIVASEKFNKNDTSVTAQVLKVMAAKPDAVLVIAAGTPGVLPQSTLVERGFKGAIYQTTGVTTNDFLRVGGKAVEGAIIATGPLIVADQLPESNIAKAAATEFAKAYNDANGANSISAFPGFAWDGFLLAQAAIPVALEKAKPGTPEFRAALNDALQNSKAVVTTSGPVTLTPKDHTGFTPESLVLIQVKDGKWTYLPN